METEAVAKPILQKISNNARVRLDPLHESHLTEPEMSELLYKGINNENILEIIQVKNNIKESVKCSISLDQTDSTGVFKGDHSSCKTLQNGDSKNDSDNDDQQEEEAEGEDNLLEGNTKPVKKRKLRGIYAKKVHFYVRDCRYDIIKRTGRKELMWKNIYKESKQNKAEVDCCNIIWSDLGLLPEKLQNMKAFQ
ncbi:unnamed protein product [Moneuplotes crassus]|uniref:Uncharacterized protein n=1 Tax=Euplotes crassus TaxID=5936 RepID=A0AAD1XGF5_EUPCR|nr:unnamed protein product [Moneuplotes crassus]